MVSGKVKSVFGFQKTPPHPKQENSNRLSSCSSSSSNKSLPLPVPPSPPPHASPTPTKTVFSRSFGVYFPRSTQVQPRPPDVIDLVRLIDELRENESRLRTELMEQKLLKETVKIVPFLESEISSKNAEIALSEKRIEILEAENASLRWENDSLKERIVREGSQNEKMVKEMKGEIAELKKALQLETRIAEKEECSSMVALPSSTLPNRTTKSVESRDIDSIPENQQAEISEGKRKDEEACCGPDIVKTKAKSNAPRVPKPPPVPSYSSSSSSAIKTAKSRASLENAGTAEPPALLPRATSERGTVPPPPPLPPKRLLNAGTAKVRRVPEVAELYHSLMRRDSRKESYAGVTDAPPAANARDMIGEIENRSVYLLAVSNALSSSLAYVLSIMKIYGIATGGGFVGPITRVEMAFAMATWLRYVAVLFSHLRCSCL